MNIPPFYKKIGAALAFVLIAFFIGYALYLTFFKTPTAPSQAPAATSTPAAGGLQPAPLGVKRTPVSTTSTSNLSPSGQKQLPADEVASGGPTKATVATKMPAQTPTISADTDEVQYYKPQDGRFYRLSANGQAQVLANKIFHNVKKITWQPQGEKAILEYPDGANIVYDFKTGRQITLPKHWQDFSFSADGQEIALKSIGLDINNQWLAVAKADGSQAKIIGALGENKDRIFPTFSPNKQIVALKVESEGLERQKVYFIGQHDENFKALTVEGRGFEFKWNPDGKYLLYSVYSSRTDLKPLLWATRADGDNIGAERKSLNLQTWAHKCVFKSKTEIICAVPNRLPEGAGLSPDIARQYPDSFYLINIKNKSQRQLAVPTGSYSAQNLMISTDGRYLYFTDAKTNKLYKINLK